MVLLNAHPDDPWLETVASLTDPKDGLQVVSSCMCDISASVQTV